MEGLFAPCTRLRDILESEYYGLKAELIQRDPEHLQELYLNVSTQELLSAERGFTFAGLYAMLGNDDTVLWLTPHAAVAPADGLADKIHDCIEDGSTFTFNADGKGIVALARSPEHLLEICDIVLRLLAMSVVHSVILDVSISLDGEFINAPTLAYLMEQCQSLKFLALRCLEMDENHCRVLGAYSKPGLEIELFWCKITSTGASALAEALGRNQGPTKLDYCDIDNLVLADGLRGNSRLKYLRPMLSSNHAAELSSIPAYKHS
jgi:hypothetical protein